MAPPGGRVTPHVRTPGQGATGELPPFRRRRTLVRVLVALALASALAAGPAEDQVERALRSSPPGGPRAAAATRPLLDAPYLPSALGEGAGRDPDPRFRLDAFDCMTLVETALALGSAATLEEARLALDDVRYGDAPSYEARNHEVLSQWIPQNARKGWIASATGPLAARARPAEKDFSPASWRAVRAAGRQIPGVPRARLPAGRFSIPVVPAAKVPALARLIGEGSLVFVVRTDAFDRATLVTHAGLVVRGAGGATLVRHATRSRGINRVIEEPLVRFLRRQERALPRWPVEGLAFFAVPDNAARVRALSGRHGTPGAGAAPASTPAGL